jgi:5-methylcytosine-specific restriction endonuclease McrA
MTTEERILQIKALHPELGYGAIAKIIGMSKSTVKFHLSDTAKTNHNAKEKRRRSAIRLEYKMKAGGHCVKCGYDKYLEVLDFHHRIPTDKAYSLGSLFSRASRDTIESEIAKCDLLCSNCHREAHIEDGSVGKNIRARKS